MFTLDEKKNLLALLQLGSFTLKGPEVDVLVLLKQKLQTQIIEETKKPEVVK